MRVERAAKDVAKGWTLGPWNSGLPISLGFANEGIDEPHLHRRMTEIYLMARGTAVMQVEDATVTLGPDEIIVIEPGEAHTFLSSSPDHFHFVIHVPGLQGDEARADKVRVPRARMHL